MLCTKCGKRPASVHVEQRLNGQKMEEYLCEEIGRASGRERVFITV